MKFNYDGRMDSISSKVAQELLAAAYSGTKNDVRLVEEGVAIHAVRVAEEQMRLKGLSAFHQVLYECSRNKLDVADAATRYNEILKQQYDKGES